MSERLPVVFVVDVDNTLLGNGHIQHQGKFANDPKVLAAYPRPDVTAERIGDLLSYKLSDLLKTDPVKE